MIEGQNKDTMVGLLRSFERRITFLERQPRLSGGARGVIGVGPTAWTGEQTIANGWALTQGVSLTSEVGRLYKATFNIAAIYGSGSVSLGLYANAAYTGSDTWINCDPAYWNGHTSTWWFAGNGVAQTYDVRVANYQGSGPFNVFGGPGMFLMLEDVGPTP